MVEDEEIGKQYLKGFNEGYLLAKHMPGTYQEIIKSMNSLDRIVGIKEGGKQFFKEERELRLPTWLKPDRLNAFNVIKDYRVKTKGKNGPEII